MIGSDNSLNQRSADLVLNSSLLVVGSGDEELGCQKRPCTENGDLLDSQCK